jgi:ribosomal protein L37E
MGSYMDESLGNKGQHNMTCRKVNKNALHFRVNSCVHCYTKDGRLTTGRVELTSYLTQLGDN